LNILFVLYHDFTANSASHTASFANELQRLGHDCCIAVPANKSTISCLGPTTFQAIEFSELPRLSKCFRNERGPDIVHAWTPREIVRTFSAAVLENFPGRLFVHLEDNEWHILSCALNRPVKELFALTRRELDRLVGPGLSHPRKAIDFMSQADGITVIIDRLAELSPPGVPTIELWPSADPSLFFADPISASRRAARGIAKNSFVIAYTGNVHAANAYEMRSLYLAVAILNREGFPTTLVRAGRDFYPFLGPNDDWARPHAIELGLVPHVEVRSVLALADVLVQPGKSDQFNDYRFPSKVPEFLSVGRPVVLPNANIAKHMTHRKHGYVLDDPSAVAIADAIREIMSDPDLYATLSAGSLEFFQERLSWRASAQKLNHFYLQNSNFREANLASRALEV
jgi:glycosyltransferase involved in cell wall biosynthesis